MITVLFHLGAATLVLATVLGLLRVARGPTALDRIIAFDGVVAGTIGLTALLSRLWRTPLYLELVLIIASLGFLSTVAFVLYLQRTLDAGSEGDLAGGGQANTVDRREEAKP